MVTDTRKDLDTRKLGTLGLAAGTLWMAVAALGIALEIGEDQAGWLGDREQAIWGVMTVSIVTAGLLTVSLMAGLRESLGLGKVGIVGLVLAGIGTAAGVIAWAFPLWGGLIGLGMLIFGLGLRRQTGSPRSATLAFAFGMLGGIALFILLDAVKLGSVDSYGDYPMASTIGLTVMLLTSAIGSIGIGRWLRDS